MLCTQNINIYLFILFLHLHPLHLFFSFFFLEAFNVSEGTNSELPRVRSNSERVNGHS